MFRLAPNRMKRASLRAVLADILQWRHNESNGVSIHQGLDCLFNRSFRHRSKKILQLRVIGRCEGNPPVIQGSSNAEYVSIWWLYRDK